jgi:hypothetical protein
MGGATSAAAVIMVAVAARGEEAKAMAVLTEASLSMKVMEAVRDLIVVMILRDLMLVVCPLVVILSRQASRVSMFASQSVFRVRL